MKIYIYTMYVDYNVNSNLDGLMNYKTGFKLNLPTELNI